MADNQLIEEIAYHISAISSLLGISINESNKDTPKRIAKMYCDEIFRSRNNNYLSELNDSMKTFPAENKGTIIMEVPVMSTCEHHWMPFIGSAKITYIPKDKIIGLSKIPRVVEYFSKKPQLQEVLTREIGEYLVSIIEPAYLCVRMTCEHTCVTMRGVKSPSKTTTVYEFGGINQWE